MSSDRGRLDTERVDPRSTDLDTLDTEAALVLFTRADREAVDAVAAARPALARAVDLVAARLRDGGRLLYVGAGTSGRLGALDASECPPTFASEPGQVQFLIAGGPPALTDAVEGAEDDEAAGAAGVAGRGIGARDVVLGITASGTTPFVRAALVEARRRAAATILLACVPADQAPAEVDVDLRLLTGPELLAGSTRLKAGSATKLALNALTTLVMVRLGKVHGNLMVDLDASANAKLTDRATRIVARLTGSDRAAAAALLERAGGRVKTAALMHASGLDRPGAEQRLAEAGGHLRRALAPYS